MVGGTPSSHGGGGIPWVPPPSRPGWGGTLGIPPPSRPGWGTPHHPDLTGVPPIQTWPGYPPPSRPDWGTPPSRPGRGTPHHPDLARVPLHHPDLTRVSPHHSDMAGVPLPPPSRCGLTHKVKILPSLILRMRAVICLTVMRS